MSPPGYAYVCHSPSSSVTCTESFTVQVVMFAL